MQLKSIFLSAAIATACIPATAQVANYAISLEKGASVDCGAMPGLDGASSFSLQLWLCPDQWTSGATILKRGADMSLALSATEGNATFKVGSSALEINSQQLKAGLWSQITIICDNGSAKALVNGADAGRTTLSPIEQSLESFTIGGGEYAGRIDEIRIWNDVLEDAFGYFINNTLNIHAPQWDNLLAYYKMDQSKCDHLVDYKALYNTEAKYNNHGVFSSTGVKKVLVDDNDGMPYLINGAYTANERFYDRAIERDQYLLSNDLIILGAQSMPDGHVLTITPNNHAIPSGGVAYLAECDGRHGVASFDGSGLLTAPERTLSPAIKDGVTAGFTFETWLYVDEWVEGAYLFRKESADAKQGFSVRLGEEGKIMVRCNEAEYGANLGVTTGAWHHLAIVPRNTGTTRTTFLFAYDGVGKSATTSLCNGSTDCTPLGLETMEATLGYNFKGKLDETMIWDMSFDAQAIKQQSQKVPMPGFGIVLTSDHMQKANTCYLYDEPENIGFSSYSQDNWRDIMMSAYKGYQGSKIRISVKSHDGWQNTIANATRRQIFANDLGKIAEGYDGVELDLEWMDGTQTNLGLLGKAIREALPQGKTLFISCHAYGAYRFPKDDMQYVDGFTFQQYGPQETFFKWDNYTSSIKAFINYGFEKSKIMTSYATTTSRGASGSSTCEIAGVRDGFFSAPGFEPTDNTGTMGGYTFTFTGPDQTYRRAAYCVENGLQGIFYWDMGNDLPVENPYNLAKWASYGLNANVDLDIEKVEVNHLTSSLQGIAADNDSPTLRQSASGDKLYVGGITSPAKVNIYSISGAYVCQCQVRGSIADISALAPGLYVARLACGNSEMASTKIIRK